MNIKTVSMLAFMQVSISVAVFAECHPLERKVADGYDLSFLGGELESVRGFKFGSAPATNGTTDVVLKLDPPVRHFDKIHLSYHSNRLHTVTFCGGIAQDREPHIRTLQEEQRILTAAGFSSWLVKTNLLIGGINDRDPICYVSQVEDRQVILSSPFFHPLDYSRDESLNHEKWMPTVTFAATDVKMEIGELYYNDPPRQHSMRYMMYQPREIGGLGLPYKMYLRAAPDFESGYTYITDDMFYERYYEEDRSKLMSLLASRLAQSKSIHCEDYDVIQNDDRIESVAGFNFGSAPTVKGTTDVILKLDKPLRDFTMVHLGYYLNRLHTVSFMGFSKEGIVALEKEQEILAKKGFCTWQRHNVTLDIPINNGKSLKSCSYTDRFTWFGASSCIDIVYAKSQFYWHPELLTVVFMDQNVNRSLNDVNDSPKKKQHRFYNPFVNIRNLREIRGLGRLAEYYFQDPSEKQPDKHFSPSCTIRESQDLQSKPQWMRDSLSK